jgi:hypothetical protein
MLCGIKALMILPTILRLSMHLENNSLLPHHQSTPDKQRQSKVLSVLMSYCADIEVHHQRDKKGFTGDSSMSRRISTTL